MFFLSCVLYKEYVFFMSWCVYILRSQKDKTLYIGSTNNLKRRFFEHNNGCALSTKSKMPWSIESYVVVKTEKKARSLEKYFKAGSGKNILKKRILEEL